MENDFGRVVDGVTKRLVDEGRLIEAGWRAMQISVLPADASEIQITEMRKAFFAGAQHLYASMMSFLEPGQEETPTDMRRMENIDKELRQFVTELKEETFT